MMMILPLLVLILLLPLCKYVNSGCEVHVGTLQSRPLKQARGLDKRVAHRSANITGHRLSRPHTTQGQANFCEGTKLGARQELLCVRKRQHTKRHKSFRNVPYCPQLFGNHNYLAGPKQLIHFGKHDKNLPCVKYVRRNFLIFCECLCVSFLIELPCQESQFETL